MKNLLTVSFYKKHWFAITVVAILFIATFFRFYDYTNRYALAGDQARDVLVAREALRNHKIPPIGPFSSAGKFTTGNAWYIWLIASQALYPNSFLTPWIILSFSFVGIVFLMILIGKELGGKSFGIILGLLTAFSVAQISQGLNITNPSLVGLFSTLAVLFALKYLRTGKGLFIFLLGLFVALAISSHFQSIYLLPFLLFVMILRKPNLKVIVSVIAGLILPTIPYLLFDIQNNFYNLRGIADYNLYGQYKVYIANRWVVYALDFIPNLWGRLLGEPSVIGYVIIYLLPIVIIYAVATKKITKPIVAILVSTIMVFFLLRYYRGEKFDGYFVFLHPFMLILTGWICNLILRLNKYAGIVFTILIIGVGLNAFIMTTGHSENEAYRRSTYWGNVLIRYYPQEKFAVYGYSDISGSLSLPFVLYLDSQNKIDDNGRKIGLGGPPHKINVHYKVLRDEKLGEELWDLNSSSSAELKKVNWHPINPSYVYATTTEWNKNLHESHGFKMLVDLVMSKFRK